MFDFLMNVFQQVWISRKCNYTDTNSQAIVLSSFYRTPHFCSFLYVLTQELWPLQVFVDNVDFLNELE